MSANDGISIIAKIAFMTLFGCMVLSTGAYISQCSHKEPLDTLSQDSIFRMANTRIVDINVKVTSYQPTIAQCDSSPFITASGDHIKDYSYGVWCAISKDLLYTKVNFGDSIYLVLDSVVRVLVVKDIVQGSKHIEV